MKEKKKEMHDRYTAVSVKLDKINDPGDSADMYYPYFYFPL